MSLAVLILTACYGQRWQVESKGSWNLVTQRDGQSLGYSPVSGIQLISSKGFAFKDLNRNGRLDIYEDWRKPAEERASNLASQLSIEQIAGLMLYSAHQAIPASGYYKGTYNGKSLEESGEEPSALTDAQKKFLKKDNLRAVLVTSVQSPVIAAQWNNNVQAFVEGIGHGIPSNNSSDPRHETRATAEFDAGAGGQISLWPSTLGLAATFDPALVEKYGRIAAKEYRALGINTALSPQIDLATEPRWGRFSGTFGEDPHLDTDMARAYVDGFQTSTGDKEIAGGWGYESVNAMVKHWPGGGPEEGGRDAHYNYGKYAVYPGNNFEQHLQPFTEGAFKLNGPTQAAAAVMPYYTISYRINPRGENVGNSYNDYIITDLLRNKYEYNGVVCTDWMITADNPVIEGFSGKCWGMETATIAERHYKALLAGIDQFGGNNDIGPVLEAYKMWVRDYGEEAARIRFEISAKRLLLNIFRTGLFENPYLDLEETSAVVGNPEFMAEGFAAQIKSVVMLKNHDNTLPVSRKKKVYVAKRYNAPRRNFYGQMTEAIWEDPINTDLLKKYYDVTDNPKVADFAIVVINEPASGMADGYDVSDRQKGGNGYVPISLQYQDYTAADARKESLAGGDPKENFTNRSYKDKTVKTSNISDLKTIINIRKQMKDKPVVVAVTVSKPLVMSEFEPYADAILVTFGVQNQVILDIISGENEPSALLPMQMPKDMRTVELQKEDVPRDMECYIDSDGNAYDFAFGLNWSGVIRDARVEKYLICTDQKNDG